jgi:FkbM family methyltransferase
MGFCDNLHHFKIYDIFVLPGTVAIDVGANLGIHSLVLSRCVGEYGKVFLFEPVNKLIKALKKNLAVNKVNNAVIIRKGAGESIGQQPFTFIEKEFNIGKGRVDYESKVFCKFSTIDFELKSNNQKISLIKIDTEGYELNVLKGAIKSISDSRPVLVIEFNPGYYSFEELKQYVPNNYSFYRIPEFNYLKITRIKNDEIDAGDILIIPTEKITPEYLSQLSN